MKSVRRAATEDHSREDAEGAGRLPAQRRQAGEDDEEGEGSVQRRRAGVPGCVRALRLRRFGGAKAGCARLVLLAACCAQTVRAGLFQFMTRHNRCHRLLPPPSCSRRTRARKCFMPPTALFSPMAYSYSSGVASTPWAKTGDAENAV